MLSIILAISLFSSLNPFSNSNAKVETDPNKICSTANTQAVDKLCSKYKMRVCGSGIDVDGQIIGKVIAGFVYTKPVADIDDARTLLINICKDYYENIKQSKEIQPYLKEEFRLQDISISLIFRKSNYEQIFHPKIGRAAAMDGLVLFATDDPYNPDITPAAVKEKLTDSLDMVEGRIRPFYYKELPYKKPRN